MGTGSVLVGSIQARVVSCAVLWCHPCLLDVLATTGVDVGDGLWY